MKTLAALLALTLLAFLAPSCKVGGGTAFGSGLPVVLQVELVDSTGKPSGWAFYDGDTLVARSDQAFVGRIVDKLSRITIAQLEFTAEHGTIVHSRKRHEKLELAHDAPLPAWVALTGVFGPGEAEARGVSFEAPPTP